MQYSSFFKKQEINLSKDFIDYVQSLPLFNYIDSAFSADLYTQALNKFSGFDSIIHLGTGGSSLGPQALYSIAPTNKKNFNFFDNIDPITFKERLNSVDFSKTGILVASKSGNTAETLIQLATIKKIYDDHRLNIRDNLVIITQTDGNALDTFAKNNEIVVVPHHNQIGGRFAVFAEVGILPGILMGLDMTAFRSGAQNIIAQLKESPTTFAPIEAANFLAHSKLNPVIFPYTDKLKLFGAWFAQLWGESLGKKDDTGERFGSTPIQAVGATDQHSQLQLYIDGPKDKFFTFIRANSNTDLEVSDLGIDHQSYNGLKGHTLKDLLDAELSATYKTLIKHELPVRLIDIPEINPFSLGQLMMSAVIETLYVAKIWNVNPFDQPAVEEGKILAMQFLNDK